MNRSTAVFLFLGLCVFALGCPRAEPGTAPTPLPSETPVPGRPAWDVPLSSVVALSFGDPMATGAKDLGDFIDKRLDQYATGSLPGTIRFPLRPNQLDLVHPIDGVRVDVVVSWLDPITPDVQPSAPRFGAGNDYTFFFGDGWNATAGDPPQWHGDATKGWLWVNHEDMAGIPAGGDQAASDDHRTLAAMLKDVSVLDNDVAKTNWSADDVDTYVAWHKKQLGASWIRVERDKRLGWRLVPNAGARRYDGTSATRLLLTGQKLAADDHDDDGKPLPPSVIAGTFSDCSGTATPWGTVIVGEENVYYYYGDAEPCWTSDQQLIPGAGCDAGRDYAPDRAAAPTSEFGRSSHEGTHHDRDQYGFIAELDPGHAPSEYLGSHEAGAGHKKLGAFGRGRREVATFAVGKDWKPAAGQPLVMYSSDDRRGGRVYKFVSRKPYDPSASRADVRALLDDGKIYVAQLDGLDYKTGKTLAATGKLPTGEHPGHGRWIYLSVDSRDEAPNAKALGHAGTTVGRALKDKNWNRLAGFPNDNLVRDALHTAGNKVGITETNRPEDLEWNPVDPAGSPRLYIAFTKHERRTALDANGVLIPPDVHEKQAPVRTDLTGGIFVFVESKPDAPAESMTFDYYSVWQGSDGKGLFDAANPDNLAVDRRGGVWFTTDGNTDVNHTSEALFYLDLAASRREGQPGVKNPTFGRAFRIASMPPGAEPSGPSFTPDMSTMFLSVQHPGEGAAESKWPPRQQPGKKPRVEELEDEPDPMETN